MRKFAFLFYIYAAAVIAQGDYRESEYSLSGTTETGSLWQIYIDCHFNSDGVEIVTGRLEIDGLLVETAQIGELIETSLGNLQYYGSGFESTQNVDGWYFESWPRTCSYLPK